MKIDKISQVSELFKLFSDPTRVRILKILLAGKEMCVNEIADSIKMSHSATSHQLSRLEARDIVLCERQGKTMCYKINKNTKTEIFRKVILMFR